MQPLRQKRKGSAAYQQQSSAEYLYPGEGIVDLASPNHSHTFDAWAEAPDIALRAVAYPKIDSHADHDEDRAEPLDSYI